MPGPTCPIHPHLELLPKRLQARHVRLRSTKDVDPARLEYRHGYRHAHLGEVPAPVVYGVQGGLREYYGVAEGPPVASTLDHIAAAVAG